MTKKIICHYIFTSLSLLTAIIYSLAKGAQDFFVLGLLCIAFFSTIHIIHHQYKMHHSRGEILDFISQYKEKSHLKRLLSKETDPNHDMALSVNHLIERFEETIVQNKINEKARKELLSNISHDIRTPLTAIIGYIEALQSEKEMTTANAKLYLDVLSYKSESIKLLIDQIFQLAKLEANDLSIEIKEYELNTLITDVVIEFVPEIQNMRLDFINQLSDTSLLVYCDKISLQRIMRNLISNSLQHSSSGSLIGIRSEKVKDQVCVSVWNNGPSIPRDEIPKLINRYFRIEDPRNPNANNSGLGLAITHKLLALHESNIHITSGINDITTFSFKLKGSKQ